MRLKHGIRQCLLLHRPIQNIHALTSLFMVTPMLLVGQLEEILVRRPWSDSNQDKVTLFLEFSTSPAGLSPIPTIMFPPPSLPSQLFVFLPHNSIHWRERQHHNRSPNSIWYRGICQEINYASETPDSRKSKFLQILDSRESRHLILSPLRFSWHSEYTLF